MRNLTLGVFLGVWITLLLALVERYKMSDYLWVVFVIVTLILIFLGLWRPILKIIAKYNPELWLKINQIFAPAQYDEAMQKRIAEREAKKIAKQRDIKRNNEIKL